MAAEPRRGAARAYAKLNLSLRVGPRDDEGWHPLVSVAQSIDWADRLELVEAASDDLDVSGDAPAGRDNLAWRAVTAIREAAGCESRFRLKLRKSIPVAAGLGGGSADAAAAALLAVRLCRVEAGLAAEIAPALGADVPFCLRGGRAVVEGRGEQVAPARFSGDFAIGVVVPPVELATAAVYAAWDRLEGPAGPEVAGRALPPSLRPEGPFANDLYAAAVALAPELDEWRAELASRWGRPVMMTGSGSGLFGYFVDTGEAAAAVDTVPPGARATRAAAPVAAGVVVEDGGTLDAAGPWGVV